jgi:hypothetical protein
MAAAILFAISSFPFAFVFDHVLWDLFYLSQPLLLLYFKKISHASVSSYYAFPPPHLHMRSVLNYIYEGHPLIYCKISMIVCLNKSLYAVNTLFCLIFSHMLWASPYYYLNIRRLTPVDKNLMMAETCNFFV